MAEKLKKVLLEEPSRNSDDPSITEDQILEIDEKRQRDELSLERVDGAWAGCFSSFFGFIKKPGKLDKNEEAVPEIDFAEIKDSLVFVGSGGQGAVYRGKYKGETVAVKMVKDVRETETHHLNSLRHANIVHFRGVCTKEPNFCLVMEFCAQGSLYDVIKDRQEILPPEVITWARQIAGGMQFLHHKKIIHRDLKSANILVGSNDELKISDFGTSRKFGDRSTPMTMVGTVAWMAPELIRGKPASEKVDVWSYGVLIWELLTMQRPYEGFSHQAIIYGVGIGKLTLPIPATCPGGLKQLMQLCWAPKAKNRPSFKHVLMHLGISAEEFITFEPVNYIQTQVHWKSEILQLLEKLREDVTSMEGSAELVRKREEELKEVLDIKEGLQQKANDVNQLYEQMMKEKENLDAREEELKRKEIVLGRKKSKSQKRLSGEPNGVLTTSEDEIFDLPVLPRRKKKSSQSSEQSVSPVAHSSPGRPKHLGFKSEVTPPRHPDTQRSKSTAVTPGGSVSPSVKEFLDGIRSRSSPFVSRSASLQKRLRHARGHTRNWSGGFDFLGRDQKRKLGSETLPRGSNLRRSASLRLDKKQQSTSPVPQSLLIPVPKPDRRSEEEEDVDHSDVESPHENEGNASCEWDADESSSSEDEEKGPTHSRGNSSNGGVFSNVTLLKTFYDKNSKSPVTAVSETIIVHDSGFQTPTTADVPGTPQ